MRRLISFVSVVTLACFAFGQTQPEQPQQQSQAYQPAVPPPSMGAYGGGYGGYYGGAGTTAAGSSMTGMANVISSKGDYNLSTSAAAVNMTQAQKQEIQNRQDYTNTYFEMRATNKAAREAERGPHPTAEQIARLAHEMAPQPLSPGQLNAVTGKLNWPSALQLDVFAADRANFEKLFSSYSQLGALSYADQVKARQIINSMNQQLKSQIRELPPQDYGICKGFLNSLMYTACKTQLS